MPWRHQVTSGELPYSLLFWFGSFLSNSNTGPFGWGDGRRWQRSHKEAGVGWGGGLGVETEAEDRRRAGRGLRKEINIG